MNARFHVIASIVSVALVGMAQSGPLRLIGDSGRDMRQTIQARRLLAEDPELTACNIGVVVENRVATLVGAVPSTEFAFRAELCLKTMIGIVEVRNELFVSEIVEPIRRPLKIEAPPQRLPELLPPQLPRGPRPMFNTPGVLTGQDTKSAKKSAMLPTLKLKQEDEPVNNDLERAVRAVLSQDAHRGVQFRISGRHVYLKADDHPEAMHDAARAIARLPNVAGVILIEKAPLP